MLTLILDRKFSVKERLKIVSCYNLCPWTCCLVFNTKSKSARSDLVSFYMYMYVVLLYVQSHVPYI